MNYCNRRIILGFPDRMFCGILVFVDEGYNVVLVDFVEVTQIHSGDGDFVNQVTRGEGFRVFPRDDLIAVVVRNVPSNERIEEYLENPTNALLVKLRAQIHNDVEYGKSFS